MIRADQLAREALDPDSPIVTELVEHFGQDIAPGGVVDRQKLADVVFHDADARGYLESLVHPEVARRARLARTLAGNDANVVYDVPLLVEKHLEDQFDLVVVVEAPESIRLARLELRGVAHDDARARMASQATDAQRREVADFVIDNSGDWAQLAFDATTVWNDITA